MMFFVWCHKSLGEIRRVVTAAGYKNISLPEVILTYLSLILCLWQSRWVSRLGWEHLSANCYTIFTLLLFEYKWMTRYCDKYCREWRDYYSLGKIIHIIWTSCKIHLFSFNIYIQGSWYNTTNTKVPSQNEKTKRKAVQQMTFWYEQRVHCEFLELHLKVQSTYILMSYRKKTVLWIFILFHIIKRKELLFIQMWAFSNPGFFYFWNEN